MTNHKSLCRPAQSLVRPHTIIKREVCYPNPRARPFLSRVVFLIRDRSLQATLDGEMQMEEQDKVILQYFPTIEALY